MLTDEQLVARAQAGDPAAMAAIVDRYEGVVVYTVTGFYSFAGEHDDLKQEARIGVFKAVRDYKPERGNTFKSFAFLCCKRQLFTAIKAGTRMKHETLTWASRAAVNDDGDEIASVDTVEDPRADIDGILERSAQLETVVRTIASMSPLERESIIGLVFLDESYAETEARILPGASRMAVAETGYMKVKVVDNALVRARRKLAVALEEAA